MKNYERRMRSAILPDQRVVVQADIQRDSDDLPSSVYIGTVAGLRGGFLGPRLTPAQARKLARWLLKAADKAERDPR